MTTAAQTETFAKELARLSKGAADDDFGNFAHFFPKMSDEAWEAVCDRAEQLLPSTRVSDEERAEWRRADREFGAETAHERRQLGFAA